LCFPDKAVFGVLRESIERLVSNPDESRSFCGNFIAQELANRAARNSSYSLRAFARDLDISAATLSNVIAGKQGVSRDMADKISERICLPPSHRKLFVEVASLSSARSAAEKKKALAALDCLLHQTEAVLDIASFEIIQNPIHFTLLESLKIQNVGKTAEQLASFLGLKTADCEECLQRLICVGLIEVSGGVYRPVAASTHTFPEGGNLAVRNFHENLLSRAINSLSRPVNERTVMNLITAVHKSDLDKINARVRDFMKDLEFELEAEASPKDDVYAIGFYSFSMRGDRYVQ
jgi:uncharacterized protein (TIGR02147 family)